MAFDDQLERFLDEIVLILEASIQSHRGNVGVPGNLAHRGSSKTVPGEQQERGFQYPALGFCLWLGFFGHVDQASRDLTQKFKRIKKWPVITRAHVHYSGFPSLAYKLAQPQ